MMSRQVLRRRSRSWRGEIPVICVMVHYGRKCWLHRSQRGCGYLEKVLLITDLCIPGDIIFTYIVIENKIKNELKKPEQISCLW